MSITQLSQEQQKAADAIIRFASDARVHGEGFILKGSAGTGKTTLIAHLAKQLTQQNRPVYMLAPTGRAARIMRARTGFTASTIHSLIYQFDTIETFDQARAANDPGSCWHFALKEADTMQAFYIVDEASMVGDQENRQDGLCFGSGRLLKDLLTYARIARENRKPSSHGSQILFVGDPAQLPPVSENFSPAMSCDYLQREHRLQCNEFELTAVQRQSRGSAILTQATALRQALARKEYHTFDLSSPNHADTGNDNANNTENNTSNDIQAISSIAGVEQLLAARRGSDKRHSSVLITFSNARALEYNRSLREKLWGSYQRPVQPNDLLLVTKNAPRLSLSNGDLVKVKRILKPAEVRYVPIKGILEPVQLSFIHLELVFKSAQGVSTVRAMALENLLDSKEPGITPLEQRALYVGFRQRNRTLKPGTAAFRMALRDDPYMNALQVKYGYAMTCHKAQGGEWHTVIVDFHARHSRHNEQFFRWAYTAITRAQKRLMTIDAPCFSKYSRMAWDGYRLPQASEPFQVAIEMETQATVTEQGQAEAGQAEALVERTTDMKNEARLAPQAGWTYQSQPPWSEEPQEPELLQPAVPFIQQPDRQAIQKSMQQSCPQASSQASPQARPAALPAALPDEAQPQNKPGASRPEENPQWHHFGFNNSLRPLFFWHLQLSQAWSALGIDITLLEHQSFCERYTLIQGNQTAVVQYYYNGKYKPTRKSGLNQRSDITLMDTALTTMDQVLFHSATLDAQVFTGKPAFVQEFYVKIREGLAGKLDLVSCNPMQNRLRIGFSDGTDRAELDFNFTNSGQWTAVQEVGGIGASRGMKERVQGLLHDCFYGKGSR